MSTQTVNEISCRPILFSGPMVKALLEGRKTQTRRIIKPQPEHVGACGWHWLKRPYNVTGWNDDEEAMRRDLAEHSPYGKVGDRLWVRETWQTFKTSTPKDDAEVNEAFMRFQSGELTLEAAGDLIPSPHGPEKVMYAADYGDWAYNVDSDLKPWKPSIHMPRIYSRITLEITEVRVQRLQDITKEDVMAEGLREWRGYPLSEMVCGWHQPFAELWESINGPGSWDLNPWLWALTFNLVSPELENARDAESGASLSDKGEK